MDMKHNNIIRFIAFLFIFICIIGIGMLSISPFYSPANELKPYHISHKNDDTIRIAFIGDSWANFHKRHHCIIDSIIMERVGAVSTLRSVGIDGITSKDVYYSFFYNDSIHDALCWGPDYCIISAGINDTDLKIGKSYYKRNMQLILDFLLKNEITPIIIEIPNYNIANAFTLRTKKEKIIRLISMLITGSEKDCIESYRKAVKQLIGNNSYDNIIYINYESWNPKGYQDSRQIYTPDMIHLNEYGYSILDSCIAKEIAEKSLMTRFKKN